MLKKLYICSAFLAVFLAFSYSAQAQKILKNIKKPMPDIAFLPEEEWLAGSEIFESGDAEKGGISYQIRLPKDWETVTDAGMSTFVSDDAVFGEIGRFYGPARIVGTRSSINVQTIKRSFHLTSEQWMLEYLLKRGYNVQGVNVVDENRVEALYAVIENNESFAVRGVSVVAGNRIILAEYFLPIKYWKKENATQNSIMASFEVNNYVDDINEELKSYLFLDVAEAFYPASWELRSTPIRSIEDMEIELLNISSQKTENKRLALNGKIDVRLRSIYTTKSLKDEIAFSDKQAVGEGLIVGEYIGKREFNLNDLFEFQNIEVFEVEDPETGPLGYELWRATLRAGDYYYFLSLFSLSRDEDYYAWTRNSQTFRLIAENITPATESLTKG